MKTLRQSIVFLMIATVAASCSAPNTSNDKRSPSASNAVIQKAQVGTTQISLTSFEHSFPVQGNIETDRNALVIPEYAGAVESIFLKEGDKVRKGDAILKMNDNVLTASRAELENSLLLAKEMFERQARVWFQKIGKEVDYLQAKSAVESLEKALETLEATIEKTTIRAPFSGVLDRIFIKEGELASPPMPVVRVIDLSDLYIRAMVSDNYINSLTQGGKVVVEISGLQPIETELRRIGSFINPANRSIDITVNLPKTENLIPNMVATVWITDLQLDSAITLQSSLVSQDSKGNDFVFVMAQGKASKRVLKTGITSEGMILIYDGLEEGDLVISRGGDRLMDGDSVTLIN